MLKSQNIFLGLKEYKNILKFYFIFILIGAFFRVIFISLFIDKLDIEILYAFVYGVRMDTIVFSALGIVFSLLYALNRFSTKNSSNTIYSYLFSYRDISYILYAEFLCSSKPPFYRTFKKLQ